jgi:hypothetical protein
MCLFLIQLGTIYVSFQQKNYSAEDGKDGTIGLFRGIPAVPRIGGHKIVNSLTVNRRGKYVYLNSSSYQNLKCSNSGFEWWLKRPETLETPCAAITLFS